MNLPRILKKWAWAVGAVSLLAIGFALATSYYGSIRGLRAALRGDSLLYDAWVEPSKPLVADEEAVLSVRVRNLTSRPVRIVGFLTTCTCTSTQSVPLTLAPRQELVVPVHVIPPPGKEDFQSSMTLYTNVSTQAELPVRFSARVISRFRPGASLQ